MVILGPIKPNPTACPKLRFLLLRYCNEHFIESSKNKSSAVATPQSSVQNAHGRKRISTLDDVRYKKAPSPAVPEDESPFKATVDSGAFDCKSILLRRQLKILARLAGIRFYVSPIIPLCQIELNEEMIAFIKLTSAELDRCLDKSSFQAQMGTRPLRILVFVSRGLKGFVLFCAFRVSWFPISFRNLH